MADTEVVPKGQEIPEQTTSVGCSSTGSGGSPPLSDACSFGISLCPTPVQPHIGEERLADMKNVRPLMALAAILLLVACEAIGIGPPGAGQVATDARPVRIEAVSLVGDRQSLSLRFTGGAEFDANDSCTVAYEATAEVVDDELVVGIFALQHPRPLGEGFACDAMGHLRTLDVELEEPFEGTRVRDLAGQVIELDDSGLGVPG